MPDAVARETMKIAKTDYGDRAAAHRLQVECRWWSFHRKEVVELAKALRTTVVRLHGQK